MSGAGWRFTELIAERTGTDFVDRRWLTEAVEQALKADAGQYVLITGAPGAGKTTALARMAKEHPEWLRFFARRDSRSALVGGDVQSFLLSIGHQLARLRPELFELERLSVVVRQRIEAVAAGGRAVGVRIDDLVASPFHRAAVLRVEQDVLHGEGEVTGVEIGTATLEPRLLQPDNLAHLALIDPAAVLSELDPQAEIVVVLDALDELTGAGASSVLQWLAQGPELPTNVRLLLSARPHSALAQLRAARADRLVELDIDDYEEQVRDDLSRYVEQAFSGPPVGDALKRRGLTPDQFGSAVVRRAAGSFLYVAMYARAVEDAISRADDAGISRLVGLQDLPLGLNALYAFFVESARGDVSRLGMLEVREPVGPVDAVAPAWEAVVQPTFGLLTVAREPLTVEQLIALGGIRVWPRGVRNVLARLRWLLSVRADRLSFFHASFGEFLASDAAATSHPESAVDELEWHERIVRHYQGGRPWSAVDWDAVDQYGLTQLAAHMVACRAEVADQVTELVNPDSLRAIRRKQVGDRVFVGIVEMAAERAITSFELAAALPTVFRLAVTRRLLMRRSRRVAPAVLGVLGRLGRTAEALGHLAALPPSRQQFEGLRALLRHTDAGQRDEVLERLVEAALTLPEDPARAEALKLVAEDVATADLERALRLWKRGHELAPSEGDAAPDAVYRVAIAARGAQEALALIPMIGAGKAGDYLDVAARVAPHERPPLLERAADCLHGAAAGYRLRCLARLAVAWSTIDAGRGADFMAATRAEAVRITGADAEHIEGLVAAAAEMHPVDRVLAEALLDRLDTATVNGFTDDAMLRGAALWAAWARETKARSLLRRVLDWNNTASTRLRVAAVIADADPAGARRIVEAVHASVPSAATVRGYIDGLFRDGDLHRVALASATYDLQRAEVAAREIERVTWRPHEYDRYTTLAELAHLHLDAGATDEALRLTEEALAFADAPQLVDARGIVPFRPADGSADDVRSQTHEPRPPDLQMTFLANHMRDWHRLREGRLHLNPVDVVRAMAPGPWSIGNPYSWARTVRVFAEAVLRRDLPRALRLVRSVADRGERAIGLAAIFGAAAAGADRELDRRIWEELVPALEEIEPHEWLGPGEDEGPFAYVRPDHRARIEAAVRLIPYEADPALELLEHSGAAYLSYAFQLQFAVAASDRHAARVAYERAPDPVMQRMHERALTLQPGGHDRLLVDIVRARAVANEWFIAASTGKPPRVGTAIEDPRYAAYVDWAAAMATRAAPRAFLGRLRAVLDGPQLPAAAEWIAIAASKLPDHVEEIDALCREIIAATERCPASTRVVTLVPLVAAGRFDAAELLGEILAIGEGPWELLGRYEALMKIFPVLIDQRPGLALRELYAATESNWNLAMALLESGAEVLVATLGIDVVDGLRSALERGLACTSAGMSVPSVLDGVHTA